MNRNIFVFFFSIQIILLQNTLATAQVSSPANLDDDYYQLRVKHVEDFINRFNYHYDARGNKTYYNDTLKDQRAFEIIKLFSKSLLERYCETGDEGQIIYKNEEENLLEKFIQTVALDSVPLLLTFTSKDWIAENKCLVKYKGKVDTITLFMGFEFDALQGTGKWAIDSCRIPFIDISPANKVQLSPVSHNMNFMGLGKTVETNPEEFPGFAAKNYRPDYLSILFFLIKSKQLVFEYVEKSIYHFRQIPGYYFAVENVKESSAHSGWLITRLEKTNEKK
ncbi:MAG: hypothetical protein AB2L20_12405 [Mangrovibacterium sp.]